MKTGLLSLQSPLGLKLNVKFSHCGVQRNSRIFIITEQLRATIRHKRDKKLIPLK